MSSRAPWATRQGALGGEQGTLGARQGEVGGRIARFALEAMGGGDDDARDAALAALQAESRRLGAQMSALARQQSALAGEQGALARQQTAAQARAARQARSVVDDALASGRARRL